MRKLLVFGLLATLCVVLAGAENEEPLSSEVESMQVNLDLGRSAREVNLDLGRSAREAKKLTKAERKEKRKQRRNRKTKAAKKNRRRSRKGNKKSGASKTKKQKARNRKTGKKGGNRKKGASKTKKRKARRRKNGKRGGNKKKGSKRKNKAGKRRGGKKRKGGKRSKKDRKAAKKAKKAAKKAKKAAKKAKKAEKKRAKRLKKKGGKSGGGSARQTCPVSDQCLDTAVNYMRTLKDKVRNYENQLKRINRQAALAAKKLGKKGIFGPLAKKLLQLGGGNASALTCAGSTSSAGATKMKTLYDSLNKCTKIDVQGVCSNNTIVEPDSTVTAACSADMKTFTSEMAKCQALTGAAACTCIEATPLATLYAKVKACDLSKNATAMATNVGTCRTGFSTCKKLIDDLGPLMHSCNVDSTALKSKAKSVKKNQASVAAAKKTINSLKARQLSWNRKRQALSSCASVVSKGDEMIALINADPSSPKIKTVADAIAASTGVTCSAEEKAKLNTLATAVEEAEEELSEAFEAILDTLTQQTGTTPSDADIDSSADCEDSCSATGTTTASTATKSSRRRRLAVEDILKKNIV